MNIPSESINKYAEDYNYEDWSLKELISECRKRDLICTRTKQDLIHRLLKDDTKFLKRANLYLSTYGHVFDAETTTKWVNSVILNNKTLPQLKEECKERDINVSGDKRTICQNIRDYDRKTVERIKLFVDKYMYYYLIDIK